MDLWPNEQRQKQKMFKYVATAFLSCVIAAPAVAAPKHHHRESAATCEARVTKREKKFYDDGMIAALGQNLVDYEIQVQVDHDCHGLNKYLDDPPPKTVTITGQIYYDGSVTLEGK